MLSITGSLGLKREAEEDFRGWFYVFTNDGRDRVAVLRAFFDESEREDPSYLVVAGCLFAGPQLRKFRREWERLFAPYGGTCRMVDLFAGKRQFEGLAIRRREWIEQKAGEIIRDRVEHAVAILTYTKDYKDGGSNLELKSPYAVCCTCAVITFGEWLEKHGRGDERIDYVFEDGYTRGGRSEAKEFMLGMTSDFMRNVYRYAGCSFKPKSDAMWLQSADVVAWQGGRHLLQRWREMRTKIEEGVHSPPLPIRPALEKLDASGKLTMRIYDIDDLNRYQDALGTPEQQQQDYENALKGFREGMASGIA